MNQSAVWPVQRNPNRVGQLRVLVAGLILLGAVAYLVWASFPQGVVYYQTVKELKQRPNDPQPVRVAGVVAAGSIQRDTANARLQFQIADSGDSLPVVYTGVVPDIFGPGISVVVEGQRDASGVFQAQTLLAKCPSRFQSAVPTPVGVTR